MFICILLLYPWLLLDIFQDQEISDLKAKMDDMAEKFGEMLQVRRVSYHCSCFSVFYVFVCYRILLIRCVNVLRSPVVVLTPLIFLFNIEWKN